MIVLLMVAWVVAAVALWRHASTEGTAGWWKWLAITVALPLIWFVVGYEISKATRRH